ncbi:MAG: ribonuclease HI [Spirochaetaceae bacterium]|jgi:ribonuclease HI|nr:ribonuclease HI [Spirochaetaceae bacterium]
MKLDIYTDGGCSGNPGPGGWGYVIIEQAGRPEAANGFAAKAETCLTEKYGGEAATTNNRMELSAAIFALSDISKGEAAALVRPPLTELRVFTDSQYLQKGMTQWMSGWKAKHWRTADKSPVKNLELWLKLDALQAEFAAVGLQIQWIWVKGHAGNRWNERCDALTQEGIAAFGQNS